MNACSIVGCPNPGIRRFVADEFVCDMHWQEFLTWKEQRQ